MWPSYICDLAIMLCDLAICDLAVRDLAICDLAIQVFQLGLFLRALRPARTGLRPARFTRALPELQNK